VGVRSQEFPLSCLLQQLEIQQNTITYLLKNIKHCGIHWILKRGFEKKQVFTVAFKDIFLVGELSWLRFLPEGALPICMTWKQGSPWISE
jgi:hypothetical protein